MRKQKCITKISWLTRLQLSVFLSGVGKLGLNACRVSIQMMVGQNHFFIRVRCVCVCVCVSQCQVRGGVSEGRDLIRCVRMGVCVWVRGVYLVKSSVGGEGGVSLK